MSDQKGPREVAADSLPFETNPDDLEYVRKEDVSGEEHRTYRYFDESFGLKYQVRVVGTKWGWGHPKVREL